MSDELERMLRDAAAKIWPLPLTPTQEAYHQSLLLALRRVRNAALDEAAGVLIPDPFVWTEEERDGMSATFTKATHKHGHFETLFAVASWILRRRVAAILALKEPT